MTTKSKKFPRCPWCGEEMNASMSQGDIFKTYDGWVARLSCDECGANSSFVSGKSTREEAVNALRELKPKEAQNRALSMEETQNRVLTMEEVQEMARQNEESWNKVRWFEVLNAGRSRPGILEGFSVLCGDYTNFHFYEVLNAVPYWFKDNDYGTKCRCWLCNPTDEERAATPWEGESNNAD